MEVSTRRRLTLLSTYHSLSQPKHVSLCLLRCPLHLISITNTRMSILTLLRFVLYRLNDFTYCLGFKFWHVHRNQSRNRYRRCLLCPCRYSNRCSPSPSAQAQLPASSDVLTSSITHGHLPLCRTPTITAAATSANDWRCRICSQQSRRVSHGGENPSLRCFAQRRRRWCGESTEPRLTRDEACKSGANRKPCSDRGRGECAAAEA